MIGICCEDFSLPTTAVTTTVQVPGVVFDPTRQVHETLPALSAVLGTKPVAVLSPDLKMTVMEHFAPGVVLAVHRAVLPALTGDVTESLRGIEETLVWPESPV